MKADEWVDEWAAWLVATKAAWKVFGWVVKLAVWKVASMGSEKVLGKVGLKGL